MPRIRTIKPEFWASESLGTRLPGVDGRQARLLFIALWNHAEDHGVCRAAPALLRSVAFPYDEDITVADLSRWLGMLEAGRFIVRYERDGSSYLWVRAFDEHQKIDRKSKTSLPEPSIQEKQSALSGFKSVASPRRAIDEPSLQEGKGREGKGMEGSGKEKTTLSAGADEPEELPNATEDAHPVAHAAEPVTQTMANAISLFPEAEAQKREKPKRKAESKGDPRHAPLVDALVKSDAEVHGVPYGFRGGRDAKAVSECLALADQNPATAGEAATAEILRRWRIARRWKGFPACNSLGDLATHWNAYVFPQPAQVNSRAPVRAETQPQYDPSKPALQTFTGKNAL